MSRPEQVEQTPPAGAALAAEIQRVSEEWVPTAAKLLHEIGVKLSPWQEQVLLAQWSRVRAGQPHWHSLPAAIDVHARTLGFRPLVNARDAAVLEQSGMREGDHFLRYADPGVEQAESPADLMLRAIEAKKNRNTGPPSDRLDGRRRRRR